jgi:hypothetical protein
MRAFPSERATAATSGMIQGTRDRQLAAEPLADGIVLCEVLVQQLDRHLRGGPAVPGREHFGEPACADAAP